MVRSMRFDLLFKSSQGHNFLIIRARELRFSKSSFLGTRTLGTNFHAYLRGCGVDLLSTCPGSLMYGRPGRGTLVPLRAQ